MSERFTVRWWNQHRSIYQHRRHEGRDAFCRAADHARAIRENGHPAAFPVVLDSQDRIWTGRRDAEGRAIWRREGELWQEEAA